MFECPWKAFEDPLWKEISKCIQLENNGLPPVRDSTDNIVYEGYFKYKGFLNSVSNYIEMEKYKAIKEDAQKQKSKSSSSPFNKR